MLSCDDNGRDERDREGDEKLYEKRITWRWMEVIKREIECRNDDNDDDGELGEE